MSAAHRRTRRPAAAAEAEPLSGLGDVFQRQRRQVTRAWRAYHSIASKGDPPATATAHRVWSDAVDETVRTAEEISRRHPDSLSELVMQFDAIWWWIVLDDNVLDATTQRWLSRFRRSVQRLAAGD